jgi:hypothetical protein
VHGDGQQHNAARQGFKGDILAVDAQDGGAGGRGGYGFGWKKQHGSVISIKGKLASAIAKFTLGLSKSSISISHDGFSGMTSNGRPSSYRLYLIVSIAPHPTPTFGHVCNLGIPTFKA